MLTQLLEQLDEYNAEMRERELAIKRNVHAALKQFYDENLQDLEEAERLFQSFIHIRRKETFDRLGINLPPELDKSDESQLPPQPEAYDKKRDELETRLNKILKLAHVYFNGQSIHPSSILNYIEKPLEQLDITLTFIPLHGGDVTQSEDKGYEILFKTVGEILANLKGQDFNATYWGGEYDYVSRFFNVGKWKHLGIEGSIENPHNVTHIEHTVLSQEKPMPDESEDAAIIKTLGMVDDDVYFAFWRKLTDALKVNGVVVSSFELPKEHENQYKKLEIKGMDSLEFESLTTRHTHYFPERLYFFEKRN